MFLHYNNVTAQPSLKLELQTNVIHKYNQVFVTIEVFRF
jgi:hypothetical protein